MKNRRKHSHIPFLVTLAGCVLMLAWVDPANATEVTRQLTQKGFSISQIRKSDVAMVKNSHRDLKVVFNGVHTALPLCLRTTTLFSSVNAGTYHFIFPYIVKSFLQADIRTWMKRE